MDFTCLAFLHPRISFWETRDLLPLTTKKKSCETQNINHRMYTHSYLCMFYVHTGLENREKDPQLVKCRFTYYLDFYWTFTYLLFCIFTPFLFTILGKPDKKKTTHTCTHIFEYIVWKNDGPVGKVYLVKKWKLRGEKKVSISG